jgi:hypothetical protein
MGGKARLAVQRKLFFELCELGARYHEGPFRARMSAAPFLKALPQGVSQFVAFAQFTLRSVGGDGHG